MYIETPLLKHIKAKIASAKSPDHILHLDFTSYAIPTLPHEATQLIQQCSKLYSLDLTNCGLQSLDNLPQLDLTTLILSNNQLSDKELQKLTIYQNSLELLTLSSNNIQSVSSLAFLRSFPRLSQLNLKLNPICNQFVDYSRKVFDDILPKNDRLTIIDCYTRAGDILSDEEGQELNMDEDQWAMEDQYNSGSDNQNSIEEQKSISSDDNCLQQMDPNKISLYHHQYQYQNPSELVELYNQHEMGLFVDPLSNVKQYDEMDLEEDDDFQADGINFTTTKKVKYNQIIQTKPVNFDNEIDY